MKLRLLSLTILAALILSLLAVPVQAADQAVFSFEKQGKGYWTGRNYEHYYCNFTLATGPNGGEYTMTFPYSSTGVDVQTFTAEPDTVYRLTYDYGCSSNLGRMYDHDVKVTWAGPNGLSGSFRYGIESPGSLTKSLTGLKVTVESQGSGGSGEDPTLGTPTELTWGRNYYSGNSYTEKPGCVSWKPSEGSDGTEELKIWRIGETDPVYKITYGKVKSEQYETWDGFINQDLWQVSGDYYFTVQEKSGSKDNTYGPAARSEIWHYTRPTAQLAAPEISDLTQRQSGNGYGLLYLYLTATEDNMEADSYLVEYYQGEEMLGYSSMQRSTAEVCPDGRLRLTGSSWFLAQHGSGDYGFRVRALGDVTQVQPSPWSEKYTFTLTEGAGGEWLTAPPEAVVTDEGLQITAPPRAEAEICFCAAYDTDGRFLGAAPFYGASGCGPEWPCTLTCDPAQIGTVKVFYLTKNSAPCGEALPCQVSK